MPFHRRFYVIVRLAFRNLASGTLKLPEIDMPRLRSQDLKNRQNSIDDLEFEQINEMQHEIDIHFREGMALYKLLDEVWLKNAHEQCFQATL